MNLFAPQAARPLSRRIAVIILTVLVSATFLYLTLRSVRFDDVLQGIAGVSPVYLVAAAITLLAGFSCMTWRSQLLLRPLRRFAFGCVFKSVFVAFVGSTLFPFRLGELLRVHYLARRGEIPHSPVLAVIVLERLLDLLCVVLLAFTALWVSTVELPAGTQVVSLAVLVAIALAGAVVVSRYPGLAVTWGRRFSRIFPARIAAVLSEKVERLVSGLSGLASVRTLLAVVGLSLAYWLINVAAIYLWLRAFDLALAWYAPVVTLLFLCLGVAVPTSTAHVGTYHFFMTQALVRFGVAEALAASVAIVAHASGVLTFLVFGILLLAGDVVRGHLSLTSSAAPAETPDGSPPSGGKGAR
ncbi:MAG: flippase-like domain-containing protein [bacterium]|nr:flippase-like domain-containing protein [bacterium]